MKYVTSFQTRLTRSARGELFNPLVYPFLLVTFSYGVGFTLFEHTKAVSQSSLYEAMHSISPVLTGIWGTLAVIVILVGFYVLVFNKPPIGKANCFVAFLLWVFATIVYMLVGGWLTVFSVALPSLIFWTWQYFSLVKFRQEDIDDRDTMRWYDAQ